MRTVAILMGALLMSGVALAEDGEPSFFDEMEARVNEFCAEEAADVIRYYEMAKANGLDVNGLNDMLYAQGVSVSRSVLMGVKQTLRSAAYIESSDKARELAKERCVRRRMNELLF